jgi:hypothetical protein
VPLALLLTAAAGCGGEHKVAPVSGRVTLDGQPLAGAHVGFQPIAAQGEVYAGGGSYAFTDADGRYTLRMVESDRSGAVVGKHRVEIVVRNQDVDDLADRRTKAPKATIPAKYNRDSTLTFDVPSGGTDKADFELKSR